jgi:serralysin
MDGGAGADRFVFEALTDSLVSARDTIRNFSSADGDRLDFSAIDADVGLDGDQAFTLVTAFTGHAGELRATFSAETGKTTIALDVNGDKAADFALTVEGEVTTGWIL